jgi:hypothetical protein
MAGMSVGGRARAKQRWNWNGVNTQSAPRIAVVRSGSLAAVVSGRRANGALGKFRRRQGGNELPARRKMAMDSNGSVQSKKPVHGRRWGFLRADLSHPDSQLVTSAA